jgi:glutaryl-CoA dehydrogenase
VWGAVGAGLACLVAARDYALGRPQFDRAIAGFQLTQAKLAEMLTAMTNASLQAYRLAALKESGSLLPAHVSMAKRHNVRAALDTARSARTILGANGISLEYPVIRHMVNLESVLTYEGTEEIHTLVLGEAATGIAAYR